MPSELQHLTIHVPNVWQTCEWYRHVFGFLADISPDASFARLHTAGHVLTFAAHAGQEENFRARRLNSFLFDPPAFHLDIATADVESLYEYALTHGAVTVLEPGPRPSGRTEASIRDLNGILIRLITDDAEMSDSH